MTARPSLQDAVALLSEEAVTRLRARSDFRDAVMQYTAQTLAYTRQLDPTGLWMLADIGRSGVYLSAVILDAFPGGATAAALAGVSQDSGATSRGRVAKFIRFAQDAGEISIPPGSEHWTRRRLILHPRFVDRLRQRAIIEVRAISLFAPEIAPLSERLSDLETFRRLLAWSGTLISNDPYAKTPGAIMMFLHRECGMRILQHLVLSQAPDRARMLEAAPISRNQLSGLYGVSRAHINRLLADAQAQGLLTCPTPRRVEFSQALSDDYELTMARLFQLYHAAYLATLATEPAAER
jgi:hypothetical protein